VSVEKRKVHRFREVAQSNSIEIQALGRAIEGDPSITAIHEGSRKDINVLRNEDFKKDSFNKNVVKHIKSMINKDIFK